jgi:hypothetical protein
MNRLSLIKDLLQIGYDTTTKTVDDRLQWVEKDGVKLLPLPEIVDGSIVVDGRPTKLKGLAQKLELIYPNNRIYRTIHSRFEIYRVYVETRLANALQHNKDLKNICDDTLEIMVGPHTLTMNIDDGRIKIVLVNMTGETSASINLTLKGSNLKTLNPLEVFLQWVASWVMTDDTYREFLNIKNTFSGFDANTDNPYRLKEKIKIIKKA